MDLKLIKNLLSMIAESEVNEVSIEEGDFKIKVKKQADNNFSQQPMQFTMPSQAPAQVPAAPSAPAPASSPAPEAPKSSSGVEIKSPIVGTFYRSSAPGADPYVKPGDKIQKGSVLCIIEAMKIMNEIEAEVSGTLIEIVATDGQPVEYDQPLFIIDPS